MVVLEFAVTFTTNLSVFSINTWGVGKIPFNRVVPVPSSWPLCISVIHFSYPQAIITISVQFSHSLMSNSLRPHGLQHARPPCLSPTPGVYSNSCPLSRWCHPTISTSVILLPSIFPSIRVFSNESALRIRWPKYWSFSFNISPSNEYSRLISFRMYQLDLYRLLLIWYWTNCYLLYKLTLRKIKIILISICLLGLLFLSLCRSEFIT